MVPNIAKLDIITKEGGVDGRQNRRTHPGHGIDPLGHLRQKHAAEPATPTYLRSLEDDKGTFSLVERPVDDTTKVHRYRDPRVDQSLLPAADVHTKTLRIETFAGVSIHARPVDGRNGIFFISPA